MSAVWRTTTRCCNTRKRKHNHGAIGAEALDVLMSLPVLGHGGEARIIRAMDAVPEPERAGLTGGKAERTSQDAQAFVS